MFQEGMETSKEVDRTNNLHFNHPQNDDVNVIPASKRPIYIYSRYAALSWHVIAPGKRDMSCQTDLCVPCSPCPQNHVIL